MPLILSLEDSTIYVAWHYCLLCDTVRPANYSAPPAEGHYLCTFYLNSHYYYYYYFQIFIICKDLWPFDMSFLITLFKCCEKMLWKYVLWYLNIEKCCLEHPHQWMCKFYKFTHLKPTFFILYFHFYKTLTSVCLLYTFIQIKYSIHTLRELTQPPSSTHKSLANSFLSNT